MRDTLAAARHTRCDAKGTKSSYDNLRLDDHSAEDETIAHGGRAGVQKAQTRSVVSLASTLALDACLLGDGAGGSGEHVVGIRAD